MAVKRGRFVLAAIVVIGIGLFGRQQTLDANLLHALRSGAPQEAETLLERGASADAEDASGSALQSVCRRGDSVTLGALIGHGATLSPETSAALLDRLSDVSDSEVRSNPEGYAQVLALLLSHGAQIDRRGALGHTPFTVAAWQCNIEICRLLLAAGADVNAELTNGLTALGNAEKEPDRNYHQLVILLRSKGAKLSSRERKGLCARYPPKADRTNFFK